MKRSVVAILTGFTKEPTLTERSLAPLRRLKGLGHIDRIIYMTWDDPALDAFLTPLAGMPDVELVRVPQPEVTGIFHERNFKYQRRNFVAALDLVPDPDALIIKLRPDFIFDDEFLAEKILTFDTLCAPSKLASEFGVDMPKSPFRAKIWIPWADANQPFFFEDGEFMGLRSDVAKLQPEETEKLIMTSGDADSDWSAHILRYIGPFLDDYPILRQYLAQLRYFVKDTDYRDATLSLYVFDPYFWHLVLANAWILATSFHVDCGYTGQLRSYPGRYLAKMQNADLATLPPQSPYDAADRWQDGEVPGGLTPCILRNYGRLMDDEWQISLFTNPELRDLTRDNLLGILHNLRRYRDGVLKELEVSFYDKMRAAYQTHWRKAAA